MIFNTGDHVVKLIGDPHLGKKFEVGVPNHRRGEREASQFQHFVEELQDGAEQADTVVMVGDLFDHPYVGYPIAHAAAAACVSAAMENPNTVFVMMAGNHDMPKNVDTVGAFDLFAAAAHGRVPNLIVARRPMQVRDLALFPWEWGVAALDQVVGFVHTGPVRAAIGHWDLSDFGPSVDGCVHLAPTDMLMLEFGGNVNMYSGHYHKAGLYKVGDVNVICTGSMEPYSHGEDPDGSIYVTITLEEALSVDPAVFKDKHVRIQLLPGETLPELDALAVTPMRVAGEVTERQTHTPESFDWQGILARKLAPLHVDVRGFIEERISTTTEGDEV